MCDVVVCFIPKALFLSFLKAYIFCWTLLGLFVFASFKASCFKVHCKRKEYLLFH